MRDLFELHRIRDPDRFRVEIAGAAPLSVPPFLLMPLAENAMKHGPGAGHRGVVRLSIEPLGGGGARVVLENPGAFKGRRPGGEGLAMVEKRLELCYQGRAKLALAGAEERTLVVLELPERPEMAG